jgi:hypothetical protein
MSFKKNALCLYLHKYIKTYLSAGKKINQSSTFGHDLNSGYYRDFREQKDLFECLHNAVPLIINHWQGDYAVLLKWLDGGVNEGVNSSPANWCYSNNIDLKSDDPNYYLWWNLFTILRNL